MGTTVVKCPVKAANVLAKEDKVALGWTRAKAEVLTKRPLQCYRCLELGHTRAVCRNEADRTGACYRCGGQGHVARGCEAPVHCPVCASKGRPADHKVGGKVCPGGGRKSAPPRERGGQLAPKTQGAGAKEGGKKKGAKPRVASIERVTGYESKGNVLKVTVPKGQKKMGKPIAAKEKAKEDKVGKMGPTERPERMDVTEEDAHVTDTEAGQEGPEAGYM
ncbi:uncharacterized protein LOC112465350 [Temnothorax curvispinosus]|uniref:Uncharacterized protein LOC112465350 n=1 Tax=Temnothorax curvispinosus TaxID=300111 RepID=A0A6J1R724_9HYME|nr:uncharacterized protein LOC112465350 [Temnothorax curvispinosus]